MDLAVIALSARPLAASAARAGLAALALDLFADLDTCAHAARCVRVHKKNGLAFDGEDLLQALASLSPPGLPVVFGGGLEHDPALMQRISERNPVLGNMADMVRALKDPIAVSALCAHLGIPFPASTLEAPQGTLAGGVLIEKRIGSLGGMAVTRRAPGDHRPPAPGCYLQRHVEGESYSIVLLSNGRDVREVGIVRQWRAPSQAEPFRYGGAAGPVALPAAHAAAIRDAARRLALACGLVGLVSLEVIVAAEGWWLLDIHPRPGASLEILDVGAMPPLLALHLAACGGKLPQALPELKGVTGSGVLYAPRDVLIPPGDWPEGVNDRSAAGTHVPEGGVICTARGEGPDFATARAEVEARLAQVEARLVPQDPPG